MLKIAFCDDDLEILKELGILLDKYKKERDEDLTCTVFQSPLELLAAIGERVFFRYFIFGHFNAGGKRN